MEHPSAKHAVYDVLVKYQHRNNYHDRNMKPETRNSKAQTFADLWRIQNNSPKPKASRDAFKPLKPLTARGNVTSLSEPIKAKIYRSPAPPSKYKPIRDPNKSKLPTRIKQYRSTAPPPTKPVSDRSYMYGTTSTRHKQYRTPAPPSKPKPMSILRNGNAPIRSKQYRSMAPPITPMSYRTYRSIMTPKPSTTPFRVRQRLREETGKTPAVQKVTERYDVPAVSYLDVRKNDKELFPVPSSRRRNPRFINSEDGLHDDDDWEDVTEPELVEDMGRLTARLDPQQQVINSRGRLVTFYRNGDSNFKGIRTAVNTRQFREFKTLCDWLEERIGINSGVRHIYRLPDKKEITHLDQIEDGRSYVASSTKTVKRVPYGDSSERFWSNKIPSAGKYRRGEHNLLVHLRGKRAHSYPGSRASQHNASNAVRGQVGFQTSLDVRPRVLTIISNTNRNCREKVILNPQTTQTYEEMLEDITSMMRMQHPPVQTLWTTRKPYHQVKGFSHLLRGLKGYDSYYACGQEGQPFEVSELEANAVPQEYYEEPTPRRSKPPRKQAPPPEPVEEKPPPPVTNGHANGHSDRERYEESAPVDPNSQRDKPYRKPNPDAEIVRVDIHGNPREFYAPRFGHSQHDADGKKPHYNLALDWVYGYRGRDARHNLQVLPRSGELVYFVASVVVLYDRNHESQRHYMEHTEDVTCISIHPGSKQTVIATSQGAGKKTNVKAHIRIWDARTLSTIAVIGQGFFDHGVSSIGFSQGSSTLEVGDLLLAVDEGEKHVLSIWRWQSNKMIAKTTTTTDTVAWGCFHPQDHSSIITFGKQHIYFWKLFWEPNGQEAGRILRDRKSGVFDEEVPKFVTSLAFTRNGDVLTGDSSGRIILWERDDQEAYVINKQASEYMRHAHMKSVHALTMIGDGTLISGGGNDIKAWDSTQGYKLVKERKVPESFGFVRGCLLIPESNGYVRSVVSLGKEQMYVATTNNLLLEGSLDDKFTTVIHSNTKDNRINTYKNSLNFVSVCAGNIVNKWDAKSHKLVWSVDAEKPCLSVAMDPEGKLVVVGTTVGRFIVLNGFTGQHMASIQAGNEQLDAIRFSPNGQLLAMGSHDCNIYVFEVQDDGSVFRKHKSSVLRGHRNFVTHLDWSDDNRYLQSVSGDYDLLFWDIEEMRPVDAADVRDVRWADQTCVLGYNLLGAWSNLQAEEDINVVNTGGHGTLLAVGDNQGVVKLYKYPCTSDRPEANAHKVYSGHVTNLRFTFDDGFLLSSGGVEAAIMQWKMITSTPR